MQKVTLAMSAVVCKAATGHAEVERQLLAPRRRSVTQTQVGLRRLGPVGQGRGVGAPPAVRVTRVDWRAASPSSAFGPTAPSCQAPRGKRNGADRSPLPFRDTCHHTRVDSLRRGN